MRHPLGDGLVRSALALLLAGCASAAVQQAYIAPTNETIASETEQGRGDRPSHTIYVINRSTVPVTVWGVALRACENIKQNCEPKTVSIKVSPGQRSVMMRVEPENLQRAWNYRFGFSWRADSSNTRAVTRVLAESGDPEAQARLVAIARGDSLRKLGVGFRELTREEHVALRERVAAMRVEPESLVLAPGERANLDGVRLLLVDKEGNIVGRTRWVRYQLPPPRVAQFIPAPGGVGIIGLRPGRATVRYALADEAQLIFPATIGEIELPIIVRYVFDSHAPIFAGTAVDADNKTSLRCAKVALEDSAQNIVSRTRSDAAGAFTLRAPRAGTYRVRVDLDGWSPFIGPNEAASADEKKQGNYPVRFTEQIMPVRPVMPDPDEDRARLTGAASPQPSRPGAAPGQTMRLAGSASVPIVEIISRVPPATIWAQFAVDEAGRLDTMSVVLPAGTAANARAAVMRALPQLRFSPARESGKPVCDLVRLVVNFSPR